MSRKENVKLAITESSGNLFADLNFVDPEKYLAKVELAYQINEIIRQRELKAVDAGRLLNIDQAKISDLTCGHLNAFSIEHLMEFLNKLSHDVEIVIKKTKRSKKRQGNLIVSPVQLKKKRFV